MDTLTSNPLITNFTKSDEHRAVIHTLIPGGAHTYSKGDDQFPVLSPAAITHGKGAYVWDLDGNRFLDGLMGLTAVSLGHAYEPVIERVIQELYKGANFSRPSVIEREMAEAFLALLPGHDMIKYGKNGSTVTSAAVKLARAYTGRKLVARPYDHPFYSYDDWFIGSTACPRGIPDDIRDLTVMYKADDLDALREVFEKYPGQIACVISEPEKFNQLSPTHLRDAIALTQSYGALYINDEMITGYKTGFPGSMTRYDVVPDMSTWGKGIANGFSFCALTGKRDIMRLGGIKEEGQEKVFLVSTTHGGETHAIAAALATLEIFKNENVVEHNRQIGALFIEKTLDLIRNKGLSDYVINTQFDWLPGLAYKNAQGEPCMGMRTLFHQELIKRGVLFIGGFCPSYSHTPAEVDFFLEAMEPALDVYAQALEDGYEKHLIGPVIKPVFRKYT
ncbi:MAG: glutamate-1-semialdehyde 2,1-aminomutase [Bacteroidia bacterium]|nr:glutamate-1-semialdehyde 2,1-aminomutase [Bacteroidia bacterium]